MKKGWKVKKLGEVCEIVNGSTPLRTNKDFWVNGKFPWFTIDDMREQGRYINYTKQKVTDIGLTKLRILPKNTVLICCTASIGEYALTNIELTTNQQFNGLIIRQKEILDPIYLMHHCSTLKEVLFEISGKTTIDFISISKLKEIKIPFPPIAEQKRIVAIIDQAFVAIDQAKTNAQKNLQNAKDLFESSLQIIFSNKGKGWEEKRLQDLTTHLGDGLHGTPKYTTDGDFYFINGNNLNNGIIKFKESTKRVSIDQFEKYKKKLADRTILVSINGTLGNVAFYNKEPIILGKSACYFNLIEDIDKNFVKYLLTSTIFQKYANKEATGSTIKNVSLKTMREFLIAFPKSLTEQQTIVAKLNALQAETKKLEAIYIQKIADLDELKKSILQKAFAGEL